VVRFVTLRVHAQQGVKQSVLSVNTKIAEQLLGYEKISQACPYQFLAAGPFFFKKPTH
jgi:enolase